jgi:hypothetical protein
METLSLPICVQILTVLSNPPAQVMNPQKLNFPEIFQTKCFSGSNFSYHYLILSQPIWPQLYRGLFAVHHKQRSNQICQKQWSFIRIVLTRKVETKGSFISLHFHPGVRTFGSKMIVRCLV